MDKLIPIYYVEYGKYISRFRAIPFYADFLIPAQRRLLLSLHEDAKGPKTVKCAKIVGHAIGKYHPHGDCLHGETLVYSTDGNLRTIKECYQNQLTLKVYCLNTIDNTIKPGIVKDFRIGQITDIIYEITFRNETKIRVTENHPFYLTNKEKWVQTKDIDDLQDTCFGFIKVDEKYDNFSSFRVLYIKKIKLDKPIEMYDFTVDGYENMLVCTKYENNAINLVCVHNSSCYGTLVALAQQGFVKTQGNFGTPGLDDANASSMRYTEACIKSWVEDFCFKYIDYVGWQNFEYENEPTFLPCPIPIGLIGDGGVQLGIAFHKCVAPRYKLNDLAKRLKWLLMEKDGEEPIIYPNLEKDGCTIQKDDLAAKKLLETGISSLTVIPNGAIINKSLHVYGRVPQTSFNSLKTDSDINIKCLSGETLDIEIKPSKKQQDLNTFYTNIYSKHLIKDINFNMCICDEEGKVSVLGVDDLLITCYSYYVEIVKLKKIDDTNKEIQKKYENEIILIIRQTIKDNPAIKKVDDIINHIKTNTVTSKLTTIIEEYDYKKDCWNNVSRIISDEDIKNICNNKNIKSLIEQEININNNNIKIKDLQSEIINNDIDCFKLIEELTIKTF